MKPNAALLDKTFWSEKESNEIKLPKKPKKGFYHHFECKKKCRMNFWASLKEERT